MRKYIFYLSSILFFQMSFSQELLDSKYHTLLEETETYEKYKVIPKTKLDAFWMEVTDSIQSMNSVMTNLKSQINDQHNQLSSLNENFKETQNELALSLSSKDSIEFLGISFSKFAYHVLVWTIITVLAILAGISYIMFFRSNKITVAHRREVEELQNAYDTHRNTARETQVKLKRELQTAINKLEEREKAIS